MPKQKTEARDLGQWLAFIEAGHSQEIELGLDRIVRVAALLGVEQLSCPVITVAGTNGKGSTVAYLAAILKQAGYRAGAYTSPHFIHYNERVVLDGNAVSDQLLCAAFERVEQARSEAGVTLTYFEFGTLAALEIFRVQQPDVVLLEVGLGGRLDAVNIVDPDIAVVTTVAIDHESWLGSDREKIGYEKAGIYREGKPALYGESSLPRSVADYAGQIGAPLLQLGEAFGASSTDGDSWCWRGRGAQGEDLCIDSIPRPDLPFDNASTALQALKLLELDIPDIAVREGIAKASLTGRFQRARVGGKQVVLDVAHNPHAAKHLAKQLAGMKSAVHCVIGMLDDKDIEGTLQQLSSLVDHWYPGTLDVPRGQTADTLRIRLAGIEQQFGEVPVFDSVCDAFDHAIAAAGVEDLVLVVGSFFSVAEVIEGRLGNS